MRETVKGAMLIIASMLIFAFLGIVVRFLNLPSLIIVFFSFFFSGILLSIFFFFRNRSLLSAKKLIWIIALLGIFNVGNNYLYFQAFLNTTISNSVLSHYTAPIFVAILAPFILKEKLEKVTIWALLISMFGLLLITYSGGFSFGSNDFIGIMYGTASGVMYAMVIIVAKYLTDRTSIFTINIYQSFFGAFIIAPFIIKQVNIGADLMIYMVLFAIVFGITGPLLHFAGLRKVKSQQAGIFAYIEPIAASLYAFIFFFEIPSLFTIIGGILIILSGYLVIRGGSVEKT